jgi:hypothetical protein
MQVQSAFLYQVSSPGHGDAEICIAMRTGLVVFAASPPKSYDFCIALWIVPQPWKKGWSEPCGCIIA